MGSGEKRGCPQRAFGDGRGGGTRATELRILHKGDRSASRGGGGGGGGGKKRSIQFREKGGKGQGAKLGENGAEFGAARKHGTSRIK